MTSLDIVNEFIKSIEDTMKEIKSGPWYDLRLLDLNKFKKIKQDLEVLNILDYRAVNIELFKEVMYDYKNNDEKALYVYNLFEHEYRTLTMEELIKIKKFLLTNYEKRVKELVGDSNAK